MVSIAMVYRHARLVRKVALHALGSRTAVQLMGATKARAARKAAEAEAAAAAAAAENKPVKRKKQVASTGEPQIKKKRKGKQARDKAKAAAKEREAAQSAAAAAPASSSDTSAAVADGGAPAAVARVVSADEFSDKKVVCKDCSYEFTFSASEQAFYLQQGFDTATKVRCSWCTKAKKQRIHGEPGEGAPIRCFNCGKNGHFSRDCAEPRKPTRCYLCGQEGHTSRDCPTASTGDGSIQCFHCGQWGHRSHECTEALRQTVCAHCGDKHPSRACPKKNATQPCRAFQLGSCPRGDACRFAHVSP